MSACHRVARPRPENANATVAGGVGGQTIQLGQIDSNGAGVWQQGLDRGLIEAVVDHRRTRPREQLPPEFQRLLGREYVAYAREQVR